MKGNHFVNAFREIELYFCCLHPIPVGHHDDTLLKVACFWESNQRPQEFRDQDSNAVYLHPSRRRSPCRVSLRPYYLYRPESRSREKYQADFFDVLLDTVSGNVVNEPARSPEEPMKHAESDMGFPYEGQNQHHWFRPENKRAEVSSQGGKEGPIVLAVKDLLRLVGYLATSFKDSGIKAKATVAKCIGIVGPPVLDQRRVERA